MGIVNYQPQQGSMQLSVAEQRPVDWSLLVNGRIVDGVLQTRPGWEIMRAPQTYSTVADPSSPDGFAYQVNDWEVAVVDASKPLGSFLFSSPTGDEWIFSIRNDGAAYNKFEIWTTSGQKVLDQANLAIGLLVPSVNGKLIDNFNSMLFDPTDKTYCFVRFVDTVFFCNGGYLWRWEPLRSIHRPEIVSAFRNANNATAGNYAVGPIYGASILAVHLDCLVVSGFEQGTTIAFDKAVRVNNSASPVRPDPSKPGPLLITPDDNGVVFNPYYMMVSDPLLPNCFQIAGIFQAPLTNPISAMASHTGRLVIWSQSEMGVISGQIVVANQISFQIVSTSIGCMGKRAFCQTSQGLLVFLGDTNVYGWDGSGIPQIVSEQIQMLFREGTQGFWRWNFTTPTYDVGEIAALPFRALTTKSDDACAVWNVANGYVAISVTSGTQKESNDLVLCWSPTSNQWWIDSVEPATPEFVLAGAVPDQYWQPNFSAPKSAAVSRHTLMVSEADPTLIFAQCYAYESYTTDVPSMSICVLRGDTDDAFMYASTSLPDKNRFAFLAISAPVFLGDSEHKLQRRLFMRTMGVRPNEVDMFVPELTLHIIPEDGHTDVVNSTDTTSVTSEQALSTWRDSQLGASYWQDAPGAPVSGMYGGTGTFPPGWQNSWIKRWYPLAPVDRRIDIPSRVTQWFRIALSKVVLEANASPTLILSTSVEMNPNYGTRRG
jgi:hypothetical protein